jgi:hypothetical protein
MSIGNQHAAAAGVDVYLVRPDGYADTIERRPRSGTASPLR